MPRRSALPRPALTLNPHSFLASSRLGFVTNRDSMLPQRFGELAGDARSPSLVRQPPLSLRSSLPVLRSPVTFAELIRLLEPRASASLLARSRGSRNTNHSSVPPSSAPELLGSPRLRRARRALPLWLKTGAGPAFPRTPAASRHLEAIGQCLSCLAAVETPLIPSETAGALAALGLHGFPDSVGTQSRPRTGLVS